ncbi:ankyrin repeat-containing protein [Tanacetum coccineum]
MAKVYVDNKSALKKRHWSVGPGETRDVENNRSKPRPNVPQAQWDMQIDYWLDPKHAARAAQNAQNRARSTVFCLQGSRSLAILRDQQMESSSTREYPSLILTFFDTHTYDGVFAQDEAREEILRLRDLRANTPTGVPYTEEEIMVMVRKGKLRGHIPGVSRVLAEN